MRKEVKSKLFFLRIIICNLFEIQNYFLFVISGFVPRAPALRNDPRPAVELDPRGQEGCLRLPVEHARRLRHAREEADPMHHIDAHQRHLLRQQILKRISVRC